MHYAAARHQICLMGELLPNARYAPGLLRHTSNNTDTDTKICIMRSQSLPLPPTHSQSTLFTSARNYEYVNETKKERVIHNTT